MTFEEFKANLQMIRSYHKSLSNFEAKWLKIAVSEQSKDNHLRHGEVVFIEGYTHHEGEKLKYYNELERKMETAKPSNYPSDFEFAIRQIIQSIISSEEDNEEEPEVIEEYLDSEGQKRIIMKFKGPDGPKKIVDKNEDVSTSKKYAPVQVPKNDRGKPDKHKRRFMILYDYFFNGYEEDRILERYELHARSTITSYQIPEGIEELYKLYNERSNDNEKS